MRWRRRIFGWVWITGVILSAILFLAAVGMWGRSYWRFDELRNYQYSPHSTKSRGVNSTTGRVRIWWQYIPALKASTFDARDKPDRRYGWLWMAAEANQANDPFEYSLFSFAYHPLKTTTWGGDLKVSSWGVGVPYWFITLLCLPLPLIAFRRWRRKRRIEREKREGLCHVCGYDLRASVDRCPEFGKGFVVSIEKHGEAGRL